MPEQPDDRPLRFADGPTVEVDTVVDAPVEVVWALVSDIELPIRFGTELVAVTWLDPGPAVGARFAGRSRHAVVGEWETVSTVTELEPGAVFGWAVGDPGFPAASWRFTLAPAGDGTRLIQWMRMGPAPSGITPALEAMPDKESRILARRLAEHRANMEANLAGIKAVAERGGGLPPAQTGA